MAHDISCGLECNSTPDLQSCLTEALRCSYSFIVTSVVHPRFRRHHIRGTGSVGGFTRSDMIMSPQDWATRLVAKISPYLDVDSQSPVVRQRHEDCLVEELCYCRGLCVPAIMLNLHSRETRNLARILCSFLESSLAQVQIWTSVPMVCNRTVRLQTEDNNEVEDAYNEPWLWWSKFHERMNWDKRIGVVLQIPADLPSYEIVQRWLGEPIKAIIIPTYVFQNNKKGYPVLSRAHQRVVLNMLEHNAQVIIGGAKRSNIEYYVQYMHRLWSRRQPTADEPMLCYAKGWEDYLQTPLQPLADNLDTHTYNVFEQDPVKYNQYQKAIILAITDLKKKRGINLKKKANNNNKINVNAEKESKIDEKCLKGEETIETKDKEEIIDNKIRDKADNLDEQNENTRETNYKLENKGHNSAEPIIVMVLGAGRGPLVRATLNAADITNTKVKVIAVEKNPCAVVVLEAQVREVWRDRDVVVIPGDMRSINLSPKADIIVSELLGSWGDNELSPECLDGAAGLLKPEGISIPCEYNSYVAPISSPCLWAKSQNSSPTKEKNFETLWVVYMQSKHDIGATKRVFTFTHPAKGINNIEGEALCNYQGLPLTDNRRTATLHWKVEQDNVMHGFAGYFDCLLYAEEMISILPSTHSPGMISWFPVYIPIKNPIRVQKGDTITATFWRCTDNRRVWYEWVVEVNNVISALHNSHGRCSEMLL